MSQKLSMSSLIQRLSPRERLLSGAAITLLLIIGLVYGGLMPGLSGARSAATRNADAAADLSLIRSLAGSGAEAPGAIDVGALKQSAEAAGLAVVVQQAADGFLTMNVTAAAPHVILGWLAANSRAAAIESFVIEAGPSGDVTANVRFVGSAP